MQKNTPLQWACFCLVFFMSLKVTLQFAQTPLTPIWTKSFGEHNHTSRDEIVTTLKDSSGNTIIVGFVERDSSFGDIMVQKIDRLGRLMWQYKYTSSYGLDYDRPVGALISKDNSVYILGIVNNNSDIYGGAGYVFKLTTTGSLAWQKQLYLDVSRHFSIASLFWGFDKNEHLHIAYTTVEINLKPTHFFDIKPDGGVAFRHTIYGIFNALEEQPYPKDCSISKDGVTTFLIRKPNNAARRTDYYTQRVTDSSNIAYPLSMTDTQRLLLSYDSRIRQTDSSGSFYSISNVLKNGRQNGFSLFKISPFGQLDFVFYSTDSMEIEAKDMILKDSVLLVTGRFRANTTALWRTFLFEINQSGQLTRKKFYTSTLSSDDISEGIYLSNRRLFLTQYRASGTFAVSELNQNLDKMWLYNQRIANNPLAEINNVFAINSDTIVLSGTVLKRKQTNNYFFSENNFYVEAFSIQNLDSAKWAYQYSDLGTSFVTNINVLLNNKEDLLIVDTEQVGPAYPAAGSSYGYGAQTYAHSVNATGQLLATKTITNGSINTKKYTSDADGNFITVGFQVQKVDKNGTILLSSNNLGIDAELVYVDKLRDEFYVSKPFADGTTVLKFDKNLTQLGIIYPSNNQFPSIGAFKFFQIKGDSAVYRYQYDYIVGTGFGTSSFSLYKNERFQWKIDTTISWKEDLFDVSSFDGSLLAMSRKKLIRISLNGQKTIVDPILYPQDNINRIFCMPTGQTILMGSNPGLVIMQAYDSGLNFVNRKEITFEVYTDYFRIGEFLLRTSQGRLGVYNARCENIFTFSNDLIDIYLRRTNFDDNYNFVTASIIGQAFYLGSGGANEAYGWRWFRGVSAKFSLKSQLKPFLTATNEPNHLSNTLKIKVFPNPVSQQLTLDCLGLQEPLKTQSEMIYLYNTLGQCVLSKAWNNLHQSLNLDVSGLPKGMYVLKMNGQAAVKIVKSN